MKSPDCHDPNPDVIPAADVVDADELAAVPRAAAGNDAAAGDATVPTAEAAPNSPFGDSDAAEAATGADGRVNAGGNGESPIATTESALPGRDAAEPAPRPDDDTPESDRPED